MTKNQYVAKALFDWVKNDPVKEKDDSLSNVQPSGICPPYAMMSGVPCPSVKLNYNCISGISISEEIRAHTYQNNNNPKPLFSSVELAQKSTSPRPLFQNAVIRRRLDVKESDLVKYDGTPEARKAALQSILSTDVDNITHREILEWGAEYQKDHKAILESLMSLFNNSLMNSVKGQFAEIIEILEESKPQAKKGILDTFMSFVVKEDSKPLSDLDKKIKELDVSKPSLYDFKKKSEEIKKALKNLDTNLEQFIISCSFFADYKQDNFPSELFLGRLSSLLATRATIRANFQQEEFFNRNVSDLIDAINNVLLTDIPMWQTNYLSVLAGNMQNSEDLTRQQEGIVSKLKQSVKSDKNQPNNTELKRKPIRK